MDETSSENIGKVFTQKLYLIQLIFFKRGSGVSFHLTRIVGAF